MEKTRQGLKTAISRSHIHTHNTCIEKSNLRERYREFDFDYFKKAKKSNICKKNC